MCIKKLFLTALTATAASLAAFSALAALEFRLQLEEKTFDIQSQGFFLSALVPVQFHETFIKNDEMEIYRYNTEQNRLSVEFQIIALSDGKYEEIVQGKFQELILAPFSDKENQLFGEYEILKDTHEGNERMFEYQGYLKTPANSFSAGMKNMLHEAYMLKGRRLIRVACTVQGLQEEDLLTRQIFFNVNDNCSEIISSVKVREKE